MSANHLIIQLQIIQILPDDGEEAMLIMMQLIANIAVSVPIDIKKVHKGIDKEYLSYTTKEPN